MLNTKKLTIKLKRYEPNNSFCHDPRKRGKTNLHSSRISEAVNEAAKKIKL
jgi:hypothetical protein